MQQAQRHPIVQRAMDVAQLNKRTISEIARDPGATKEAALIVGLVAIANGIGGAGNGSNGIIAGIVAGLIGWVVFAAVTYFVATNITGDPTTVASVEPLMRTLGYARVPGLLAVFGFIWLLGDLIAAVGAIWMLVTYLYAVRITLRMGWLRTIATVLIAGIISGLVSLVIGLILGVGPSIMF